MQALSDRNDGNDGNNKMTTSISFLKNIAHAFLPIQCQLEHVSVLSVQLTFDVQQSTLRFLFLRNVICHFCHFCYFCHSGCVSGRGLVIILSFLSFLLSM